MFHWVNPPTLWLVIKPIIRSLVKIAIVVHEQVFDSKKPQPVVHCKYIFNAVPESLGRRQVKYVNGIGQTLMGSEAICGRGFQLIMIRISPHGGIGENDEG